MAVQREQIAEAHDVESLWPVRINTTHARSARRVLELAVAKINAERDAERLLVHWVVTHDEFVAQLGQLQKGEWLSSVPGVAQACRKVELSKALQSCGVPFWPCTWSFPEHNAKAICDAALARSCDVLIVKPDAGAQGRDVSLARSGEELVGLLEWLPKSCDGQRRAVVQEYIARPLLLGGYKWDARIYVLVIPSTAGGLNSFLAGEGLARVCLHPYQPVNAKNLHIAAHLCNYSISKQSLKYDHSGSPGDAFHGGKRTLRAVLQRLEADGGLGKTAEQAWKSLANLTRQTIASMQESIKAAAFGPGLWTGDCESIRLVHECFSHCFQLLGVDVLFDESGAPWLLEVNSWPSLHIGEALPISSEATLSTEEMNRSTIDFIHNTCGIIPAASLPSGEPCRCSALPVLHVHRLCSVDVAVKLPVAEGMLKILRRVSAALPGGPHTWAEGTIFEAL